MKMLISNNILLKFIDTISDEEYQTAWNKLQDYQNDKNIIKTYTETGFQSEFLDKIFGDILGYIPRTKSLKEANLIVEHKNPNSLEKVDGAILDKNGEVKIVIELKSVKDTTDKDLLKKKRGGSDGSTPIQQAAKYLFQFPYSDLAVVSNFDTIIVFNKKEYFRQEFSLFTMNYETFKEFYLILCSNSFWSGLTNLMISQTKSQEKIIDNEFYLKTTSLYKKLHNQIKPEYADDLFNKFLALAILEDSGRLKTNLINIIYERKDDFDHSSKSHWLVFVDFFKSLKTNKKKRDFLGITDEIAELKVWQDISYLGRIKITKSTLDILLEISKYDLYSIPMDRLFFEISKHIHNPYDLLDVDDQFDTYSEIMAYNPLKDMQAMAGFQTLSFVSKLTDNEYPLVKLYNEIANNKIQIDSYSDNTRIIMDKPCDKLDYFLFVNSYMLDDKEFVQSIKNNAFTISLEEQYGDDIISICMTYKPTDNIHIRCNNANETIGYSVDIDRTTIRNKIIILSTLDQQWLREYNQGDNIIGNINLGSLVTIVPEVAGKIRLNLDSGIITLFDDEMNMWNESIDDFMDTNNFIYFTPKTEFAHLIMNSDDFNKLLSIMGIDKSNILELPISSKLMSNDFLEQARQYEELRNKINLFEYKLEKLQQSNDELAIIKCEQQLDRLYESEKDFN